MFEGVVANVFKSLGQNVLVTGYTNDGGIYIILGDSNEDFIGVQVKRYRNKIKVEQIRSFSGALILAGYKKGIFVTTSDFQRGAVNAADLYSNKALSIELLNAEKFYDALNLSNMKILILT